MLRVCPDWVATAAIFLSLCPPGQADDQPQWGQRNTRNMVSNEKGLPDSFDIGYRSALSGEPDMATAKNVKWVAKLGRETHGTPVIAGGKVLVGTNNQSPRDQRIVDDAGVLMCFGEESGEFLWQLLVPKLVEIENADWFEIGICSTPVVEDDRAYLVTNRCEVVCLDMQGMADGNDGPYLDEGRHMMPAGRPPVEPGPADADIIWLYDIVGELDVRPHNSSNCSVIVDGDYLYVCTSNGVEHTHSRVANPDAPTLIVVDKNTGTLIARDNFGVGEDVIHGQWSSPTLGRIGDKTRLFQGTGGGMLLGFDAVAPDSRPSSNGQKPNLVEKTWWFNGHPTAQTEDNVPIEHGFNTRSYEVVGNPVFHDNRIYLAITQDPFHRQRFGWLTCLDATGTGDVTRSGLIWSYEEIGTCVSTVSISDGLLFVADHDGRLHCLDAETGRPHWVHPIGGPVWGSTLVADGKLYVGTMRRFFWVLAADKELKVINRISLPDPILSSPAAANGTLYLATFQELYAVSDSKAEPRSIDQPPATTSDKINPEAPPAQ